MERLVELLQDTPAVGGRGKWASLRQRAGCASAPPRGTPGALAVALGNLGVVYHEIGDAKQASRFLEASLEAATRCEYEQINCRVRYLRLRFEVFRERLHAYGWCLLAMCCSQTQVDKIPGANVHSRPQCDTHESKRHLMYPSSRRSLESRLTYSSVLVSFPDNPPVASF